MRLGIVQQKYHGSKKKTIAYSVDKIKELKKAGANIVVLQELHQDRYFCISEDEKNFDLADDFYHDLDFWSNIAKSVDIVLVVSLFEKRAEGLYHNSAFIFESDGKLAGKYRKMHIPDDPSFYEKFYFTPGDLGFNPIKTSVGNIGLLICWDQWFPEAARIMALKGADILIYPTAIGWFDSDNKKTQLSQLEAWISIQKSHAIANALPVVCVNRVGIESDPHQKSQSIRFWGNSFVVDGQGDFLYRASTEEEVKIVDIDFNHSKKTRRTWPFFRDRRVDYYVDIGKIFID